MMDETTRLGESLIQHGPFSNRVYVMKLCPTDLPDLLPRLDDLCRRRGYTKIFAKVPGSQEAPFRAAGFRREAEVPRFYHQREAGLFLARYLDPQRADPGKDGPEIQRVLDLAAAKSGPAAEIPPPGEDKRVFTCTPRDAKEMSSLYRLVFDTYPFPIHDPGYLRETMASHVTYFGVRVADHLAALASSEMDTEAGNVEMTDFATRPDMRGQGLARSLLAVMEAEMRRRRLFTAYTIARALSPGMNITFARRGYRFGGTLVNNTQIAGRIESMNVWYKQLIGQNRKPPVLGQTR